MAYERKLLGSTYQELVRIQGTEQIVSGGRKLRFNPEKLKKAALLDQLGREITNGEAPAPEKLALQYRQISLDTGPIVFDGGVPVGGTPMADYSQMEHGTFLVISTILDFPVTMWEWPSPLDWGALPLFSRSKAM